MNVSPANTIHQPNDGPMLRVKINLNMCLIWDQTFANLGV